MNENKRVLLALALAIGAGILAAAANSAQLLALASPLATVGSL
jgi:hypothetical protein